MTEYNVGISSVRDDWSSQQEIKMNITIANEANGNEGTDGAEATKKEEDEENTISEDNDSEDESDSSSIEDHFVI